MQEKKVKLTDFQKSSFFNILNRKRDSILRSLKEEESEKINQELEDAEINKINLDPKLDKEFFLDRFTINDREVVLKTVGTGQTAPVIVYIDGEKWELFAGPKTAKLEARRYIKASKEEMKR